MENHLSRLEGPKNEVQIKDNFPDERLLAISYSSLMPWFEDYVNYLVAKVIPPEFTYEQKKKFFADLNHYYLEKLFLYKHYANQVIKRCISEEEIENILIHYYSLECGRHFGGNKTATKVLQLVFYWPTLFKDVHAFISAYDRCQRMGNISRKYEGPLKGILKVDLFDVWGIDFIGPFPSSYNNKYILLAVDYKSKWVEATPLILMMQKWLSLLSVEISLVDLEHPGH